MGGFPIPNAIPKMQIPFREPCFSHTSYDPTLAYKFHAFQDTLLDKRETRVVSDYDLAFILNGTFYLIDDIHRTQVCDE